MVWPKVTEFELIVCGVTKKRADSPSLAPSLFLSFFSFFLSFPFSLSLPAGKATYTVEISYFHLFQKRLACMLEVNHKPLELGSIQLMTGRQ